MARSKITWGDVYAVGVIVLIFGAALILAWANYCAANQ